MQLEALMVTGVGPVARELAAPPCSTVALLPIDRIGCNSRSGDHCSEDIVGASHCEVVHSTTNELAVWRHQAAHARGCCAAAPQALPGGVQGWNLRHVTRSGLLHAPLGWCTLPPLKEGCCVASSAYTGRLNSA